MEQFNNTNYQNNNLNTSVVQEIKPPPEKKKHLYFKIFLIILGIFAAIAIVLFIIVPLVFMKKAGVTLDDMANIQSSEKQQEVSDKLQQELFLSALPDEQITNVAIGGYGVSSGTLELIQQSVEKKIGVRVNIDSNYQETLPLDDRIYNKNRGQFNGDTVWQSFINNFADKGNTVRYLVVINEDIYTDIQPERPYILSRALPGNNTAVISVKRLLNESDSSDKVASTELYSQRVEKLALRTLGVTVGLSLSPDADNINCVMYQALTLEELDKTGSDFCQETKSVFEKVFLIQH